MLTVLPGVNLRENSKFDTETKIDSRSTTLSLRKRRLEAAVLSGAYLPKVDFTEAQFSNALFLNASLPRADFSGAYLKKAKMIRANLQEAKFDCANLIPDGDQPTLAEHPKKQCADLQDALLNDAHLQGASLIEAHLQGGWLYNSVSVPGQCRGSAGRFRDAVGSGCEVGAWLLNRARHFYP